MTRSDIELKLAIAVQVRFLHRSGAAFDEGDDFEALRLANAVTLLVHDGRRQTISLLTHLDALDTTPFLDSGFESPVGRAPRPLIHFRMWPDRPPKWMPHCADPFYPSENWRYQSFTDWWKGLVYKDTDAAVTREQLVLTLRDQDGGAHFDANLTDEGFVRMKSASTWRSIKPDGTEEPPIQRMQAATMRQVAWEVEQSLAGYAFS